VARSRRIAVAAALAVSLAVRVAWAVPATATGQVQAFSGCAHHCKQVQPLGAASRCCGVDVSPSDPTRLGAPTQLDVPAPLPLAVLPAATVITAGRLAPVPDIVRAPATGPPRFLRLHTLLL
jgi:hypothetical protein